MTTWLTGIVSALGLLLVWQQPQRPTFRSEVNYVELDVSVTGKDGARVRGLTKGDFEVFENGKPQKVTAFSEVNLPMPPARVGTQPLRLADPGVATNFGQSEGRVYVIVMDYGTLSSEGTLKVKRQITQFIMDFLGPNDLASIVSLGSAPLATEFTANKARLLAALNVMGEASSGTTELAVNDEELVPSGLGHDDEWLEDIAAYADAQGSRMATASIDRFAILGNVAKYLKGLQGRRKALIYVSQGVSVAPVTADPGTGELAQNAVAGAVKTLTDILQGTGVTVYSIDPRGMGAVDPYTFDPAYLGPMSFLRGLSDDTGGFAAIGYGDLAGPYRRIVEDSSTYYVLGYASDQKLDNQMHGIRVRVRGRDVDVRARDHIMATKPEPPTAGGAALAKAWQGEDIPSLLARPLPTGDLGLSMRATASAIGMKGGDAIVQLAVEVDGAGFTFTPQAAAFADDIEVAFQAFDSKQELKASRTESTTLRLRAETRDAIAARGWRYVTEFTVPAGLYQLRIAAAELNGHRAGSVFLDVPVPDATKATLSISGLAITSQAARLVPTAGNTPTVRAVSQAPITAVRTFNATDRLAVLAGIVIATGGDRAVTASAQLRAMDGKVAVDAPQSVKADDLRAGSPPRAFELPLSGVAPGDYDVVVRAADGAKTATRTLPIKVIR
jgi:VWFA-related protein